MYFEVQKLGIQISRNVATMTGGLVQEFEHSVLPSIKPSFTFILTVLSMLPALIKLWHLGADRRYRSMSFIRYINSNFLTFVNVFSSP